MRHTKTIIIIIVVVVVKMGALTVTLPKAIPEEERYVRRREVSSPKPALAQQPSFDPAVLTSSAPTSSRERLSKSKKHRPGSRPKAEPASATAPTAASQAPVATTCRPRTAHGTRGLEPSRKKSKRSAAVQEPSRNNIRAVKPEASLSTKAPTAEPLATRQGNKTASEQVPSSADLVSTQCGQATSAADLPSAVKKDPQSTSSLVRHSETAWNEGNRFPWLPVIIALVVAALVGVLALTILLAKARAALGNAHVCPQSEKDLLVNCSLGVIQGVNVEVDDGRRARVFLGIPFGAAVSEDLRFGPAHEVTELRSIFLADKKGPACVQPNIFSFGQHDPSGVSDDCLTLNVYIPDACSVRGREPLPVLFIVTGRLSYTLGWSGAYDWQHLAARGQLVVVAPNHRMGVVGYLNRGENGTANIGVKDVLLAWRWTKVHIAAFGGDPDNVVPLAHSSGAVMMTALLAKPQLVTAKRAIILSQSLFTFSPSQAGDIGLNKTRKAAGLAGCCQSSTCSSLPLDGNQASSSASCQGYAPN
ncbi:hypothetical protein HPB48_020069 [Haemaphysalis longicornis]|uniref:Carboxylesterase type B domain-containing protein n=1 Tax=Haemaphysalis longicornis TaxID=44386 RepID=A0A9J6GCX2_HAELO|nr:hypothetical protein HPB48_020069 [Haemaphysalis longicornis]